MLKSEGMGSFFSLHVNEMNEKMSIKMGIKVAASVYIDIGKDFTDVWYICRQMYRR